jgi:hypothetical protein
MIHTYVCDIPDKIAENTGPPVPNFCLLGQTKISSRLTRTEPSDLQKRQNTATCQMNTLNESFTTQTNTSSKTQSQYWVQKYRGKIDLGKKIYAA